MNISIKPVLKPNPPDKNGLKIVYIRITYNRKPKYIGTTIKIKESEFNATEGSILKKCKNANMYNSFLLEKVNEIKERAEKLILKDSFNFDSFIISLKKSESTIVDLFQKKLDTYSDKETTHRTYKFALKHFNKFAGNMCIADFDANKAKQFEVYLKSKVKGNTFIFYISIVKQFFTLLVEDSVMAENPFKNTKYKINKAAQKSVYLNENEINTLIAYKESLKNADDKLQRNIFFHLNIFFLQFYTGMRISDIITLKDTDIQYNGNSFFIKKIIVKTKNEMIIPITSQALSCFFCILNKPNKNYFFGKIILTKNMNFFLKKTCEALRWDKKITSHSARHSFGTYALNKGMRLEVVQAVLGHSSIEQTKNYARLLNQTIIDEMDKIYNQNQ